LIALHSLAHDAGGDGTGGVEIVSGWASDEPYHSIARDVAHERVGEHVWVIVWTDTAGRGNARTALAIAESEWHEDSEMAARRQKEMLGALTQAEETAPAARDVVRRTRLRTVAYEPPSPMDERQDAAAGRDGSDVVKTVDYVAVWEAATDLLNDQIVSDQKRAYLQLTYLRAIVDDVALLAVPDAFTRDVIESQLRLQSPRRCPASWAVRSGSPSPFGRRRTALVAR
jgi:hypothetical protein